MKNCQIIIKRTDHHTVTYQFDDFRVAQAVINILDNVGEVQNEGAYFEWKPIIKKIFEE